ncbi:MAG TPA: DUF4270 family protein, partial [Bacteroidetes bacterium]|nr:DUF4270 family protein [Bacteroidota bacterium]
MKKHNMAWLFVIGITTAMLFFTACTSPNNAGIEVLPDDDIVKGHFVDSFSVEMSTILVDSVLTERLTRNLFGNYVDEELGWIYAETYIQPRLTGSNLVFGTNPANLELDSIVLRLDLTGFYGRYNDPVPLEILEITQAFPTDAALTSKDQLSVDTYDYANGYNVDFSALPGFLDFIDIRLDDSLGQKLLFADPDSLLNNTTFVSFFKGLCIRSKPVSQITSREPGGIFYMDPTSTDSRLTLHYRDSNAVKSVVFDINLNSERFHHIERTDYSSRLLTQALNESGQPDAVYAVIEAGALIKTFVKIPNLKNLDPVGINKAELILKVDPDLLGSGDRFTPPKQVFLFVANESGTAELAGNSVVSTGDYDANLHQYAIPLTNNLQTILAGRLPDNGFILVPGENGVSMNRAIFAGPGHPLLAPKLR